MPMQWRRESWVAMTMPAYFEVMLVGFYSNIIAWLGKLGFPECNPINPLPNELSQDIFRVPLCRTYEDLSFDGQEAGQRLPRRVDASFPSYCNHATLSHLVLAETGTRRTKTIGHLG